MVGRVVGVGIAVLLVGAVVYIGFFNPFSDSSKYPLHIQKDSVRVASSVRSIFERDGSQSTSSGGDRTHHDEGTTEDGETVGTITFEDTTQNVNDASVVLVQETEDRWFPEWRSPALPIRRIGGASSGTVTWTPAGKSLIGWDPALSVGTGFVFGPPGTGATIGFAPIRVWNVYFGVGLHTPPQSLKKIRGVGFVSTKLRDNLSLGVGLTHRKEISLSLSYRF